MFNEHSKKKKNEFFMLFLRLTLKHGRCGTEFISLYISKDTSNDLRACA